MDEDLKERAKETLGRLEKFMELTEDEGYVDTSEAFEMMHDLSGIIKELIE